MPATNVDADRALDVLKYNIGIGCVSKVAPLAEQLAEVFPADLRFQNLLAEVEARQGKVGAAIGRYLRVIAADPVNFTANLRLFAFMSGLEDEACASAYRRWEGTVGDGLGAEDNLVEAYRCYDNAYDLFLGMSLVAVRRRQFDRAVHLFGPCLTDPANRMPGAETVETKYAAMAGGYDHIPFHRESVERFLDFVDQHCGRRAGGGAGVIDAACGTGLAGERLARWTDRLTGLDLSPDMVAQAERRGCYAQVLCGDMTDLMATRLQRSADLIVCIGATCYLEDLGAFLSGAAVALVPGGELFFSDFPAPPGAGQQVSRYATFRYCRSLDFVTGQAQANGFEVAVAEVSTVFSLPSYFYRLVRR